MRVPKPDVEIHQYFFFFSKYIFYAGNEVVAQMLLENGAKVNMESNNGTTAFALATKNFKKGNSAHLMLTLSS